MMEGRVNELLGGMFLARGDHVYAHNVLCGTPNRESEVTRVGDRVAVRILNDDSGVTYLGTFLGHIALGIRVEEMRVDGRLRLSHCTYNPAILIPMLHRVVFGYEVCWSFVDALDSDPHEFKTTSSGFSDK
jgi:hypothetical protein